jgi:hypothetical protein
MWSTWSLLVGVLAEITLILAMAMAGVVLAGYLPVFLV